MHLGQLGLSSQQTHQLSIAYLQHRQAPLLIGSGRKDAQIVLTMNDTYVQAVCSARMEPSIVLEHRCLCPVCPYDANAWERLLQEHGLFEQYNKIPDRFRYSFNLHLPRLGASQITPNHPSLAQHHDTFDSIIQKELDTGCYIGPFSCSQLHSIFGNFQTSPVSIISKLGKPGRFHAIQNFSFPMSISIQHPRPSINSTVDSDDFPCTWGTFDTICSIIHHLSPGS